MKCPACDRGLTGVQVGSVLLDVCKGGCGGIWFDVHELEKVTEENQELPADVDVDCDVAVNVDFDRTRQCPRCDGVDLERRLPHLGSVVEIDLCPRCGGYWLDCGELEKIRAETGSPQKAPAKPRRIHISLEVIRYIHTVHIRRLGGKPGTA